MNFTDANNQLRVQNSKRMRTLDYAILNQLSICNNLTAVNSNKQAATTIIEMCSKLSPYIRALIQLFGQVRSVFRTKYLFSIVYSPNTLFHARTTI